MKTFNEIKDLLDLGEWEKAEKAIKEVFSALQAAEEKLTDCEQANSSVAVCANHTKKIVDFDGCYVCALQAAEERAEKAGAENKRLREAIKKYLEMPPRKDDYKILEQALTAPEPCPECGDIGNTCKKCERYYGGFCQGLKSPDFPGIVKVPTNSNHRDFRCSEHTNPCSKCGKGEG